MIAQALSFVTDHLITELEFSIGLTDDVVVTGNLINPDGSIPHNIENKIVISIINIEHETAFKATVPNSQIETGNSGKITPPVHLNLYLLIAANYTSNKYLEAFKMLSAVISIFETTPIMSRQNFPNLEPPITKLILEPYSLPLAELSHLWNGIGTHLVPSVLYKMRLQGVNSNAISKVVPEIANPNNDSRI